MSPQDIFNHIEALLPDEIEIKQTDELSFYGFSHYLAQKLSLPKPPCKLNVFIPHGWLFRTFKYTEELLSYNREYSSLLVGTKKQQKLLKTKNYKNVHTVGYPYIYIDDTDIQVKRYPNTLLVMPIHSTERESNLSLNEESYVQYIDSIRHEFDLVVFSLHKNCIMNNLWIKTLEKYNFPWVLGAHIRDKNALLRQNILFRSFEYVTTNAMGSHVAYASYSGSKVSICGELIEPTYKHISTTPNGTSFPHIVDNAYEGQSLHLNKELFKNLFFQHPLEAKTQINWAMKVLGHKHKKSFKKLAHLCKWDSLDTLKEAPTSRIDLAHFFNTYTTFLRELTTTYSKILIYGNGTVGQNIAYYLANTFYVFIDQKSKNISKDIHKGETYSSDNIPNIDFDLIIISVLGRENEIIETLVNRYAIPKNKIQTIPL